MMARGNYKEGKTMKDKYRKEKLQSRRKGQGFFK
jgi:hypothetical protein